MTITLDLHTSGDYADRLDELAEQVKEKLLRSGGNAASKAFQEHAQEVVRVYKGEARYVPRRKSKVTGKEYGGYWIRPGQLREAIYRAFDEQGSTTGEAHYKVSWNHSKAPHGWWIENGTSRHPAYPFIRRAWSAARGDAARAGLKRMADRFNEIEGEA